MSKEMLLDLEKEERLIDVCRFIRQLEEVLLLLSQDGDSMADPRLVCLLLYKDIGRYRGLLENVIGEVDYY